MTPALKCLKSKWEDKKYRHKVSSMVQPAHVRNLAYLLLNSAMIKINLQFNYIENKGNKYSKLVTSYLFYYILLLPMFLRVLGHEEHRSTI